MKHGYFKIDVGRISDTCQLFIWPNKLRIGLRYTTLRIHFNIFEKVRYITDACWIYLNHLITSYHMTTYIQFLHLALVCTNVCCVIHIIVTSFSVCQQKCFSRICLQGWDETYCSICLFQYGNTTEPDKLIAFYLKSLTTTCSWSCWDYYFMVYVWQNFVLWLKVTNSTL